MKVDAPLQGPLAGAGESALRLADAGVNGTFTFEGPHDVFAPLVLAAASGARLDVYPNVAIALPRSPLHLAHTAYDLQVLSGGRFLLGLGSQIRAHIEHRYGATWSEPVERMREVTLAVKAILQSWQDGSALDFRGRFTTHTLMPPLFNPGPNPFGVPPVMVGAVGPRMTEMVAEVADGLIVHPLNSERTLREHTLVHVGRGLDRSGRDLSSFRLVAGAIVGVWEEEAERPAVEQALRGMLAFYSSTPAYRVMLDLEGYGDLHPALRDLTRQGRWGEMASLVDDGMLDRFTVRGSPVEVGAGLVARYGGLVDRVALSPQGGLSVAALSGIVTAVGETTGESAGAR
ncbi:MAG TPA: TIGR03617 family F420-dependent LLM class oxidoreductase [Acidimicrobiales bacterium]|nr:TIGR03617 family F420-dependent LLM class oxidoreductase [Acidimicrobiales bacterium]